MVAAGVKALVEAGINRLPKEYVRTPKGECDESDEVPVVDISGIEEDESQRALVLDAIHKACQEWGFFQLVGHGVPLELMESMSGLIHHFFNMPAEERMVYYSEDVTKTFRFGTGFKEGVATPDLWYDYLFQFCNPPVKEEELPNNIPGYREITINYSKQVAALARRLLALFSECFGLEPGTLETRIADPTRHVMRMNYFPPCPNPNLAVGIDVHSDIGSLTVLQQDNEVEGLQVLHKGRWVTVRPLRGAFVINIGDQLEILTNGIYKSVKHRVRVNAEKTRISIASFYNPGLDTYIAPMAELLGQDGPLYKGSKYADYRKSYFSDAFTGRFALDKFKV